MADLVSAYTGEVTNYSTAYSRNFGIDDIAGALAEIQAGKDLEIGGKFDAELHKKAAATLLADIPDEDFDAVIKDIDTRAEDAENNRMLGIEAAANASKYAASKTDTLEGGGNV